MNNKLPTQWKQFIGEIDLPDSENIIKPFELITPEDVSVVLLGIETQSMNNYIPSCLKEIYKEINDEYSLNVKQKQLYRKGNINRLFHYGVLILNNRFINNNTWTQFIITVLKTLDKNNKAVFIGFGNRCKNIITNTIENNPILLYTHPSSINAINKFSGCGCFRTCNNTLSDLGLRMIDWSIVFT